MIYKLICADVLDALRTFPADTFDSCVTDPPYELGFMGKSWDSTGIANSVPMWREVLRVMKPGAHLISFGGTRTYHRMACAVEDAGFEVRDMLAWLYGSGFPKSLDVSKAIDKEAGAVREVVGRNPNGRNVEPLRFSGDNARPNLQNNPPSITTPATEAAAQWSGWGTALKPAHEPCVLARKPFRGTVAANVQDHGTGAINVDGCRIGTETISAHGGGVNSAGRVYGAGVGIPAIAAGANEHVGRWPANALLDEEAAALLDEQTGELAPGNHPSARRGIGYTENGGGSNSGTLGNGRGTESGGASRFFYTAKASRAEREEGMHGAELRDFGKWSSGDENVGAFQSPNTNRTARNNHPTVKPVDLMQWLVRLVTPKGGTVLDPFVGSGSTGMATIAGGFDFVGIDNDAHHVEIARRRIASVAPMFARDASA